MAYSCSDFTDDICDALGVTLPDDIEGDDNVDVLADLALEQVAKLQAAAAIGRVLASKRGSKAAAPLVVFTLTTDGDNVPCETAVYATETAARDALIAGLETYGVARGNIEAQSIAELCKLWTQTADGVCILERHTIPA